MNNYEKIIKIRTFEEHILDMFSRNMLSGTTHTYIGEEATAVAVMNHVKDSDTVFSNHRCHGHYLAYGGSERSLLAEIMSKESGLCQGRGGSQHIHYKNFYTNGIQGGIVPNAVGVGLANKLRKKNGNVIVFLGDGTLGQGVVYEAMNMAVICKVPVVFVIEDNAYAMSTKRKDAIAGDIRKRVEGFDIKCFDIESTDVDELDLFFRDVFGNIDIERMPVCAVVHNYRLGAHSKGDDTRDKNEVEAHWEFDPVKIVEKKIGSEVVSKLRVQYHSVLEKITAELMHESSITITPAKGNASGFADDFADAEFMLKRGNVRCVEEIRDAFAKALKKNANILFIGEDIRDPYGGAFKVTKGLSEIDSERVINTPISEACIVGMSVGLALAGMIPVSEMMFGDFITLGFDQLLNHAVKYDWVYGGDVKVPMVVRVPSGAGRGYGPTHSQSLEKFLVGIPRLEVLALNRFIDAGKFYSKLLDNIEAPTVVIENKKMYAQSGFPIEDNRYRDFEVQVVNTTGFPTIHFSIDSSSEPEVFILTYGGGEEISLLAAEELMLRDEIQADVITLTRISPIPFDDLKKIIPRGCDIMTVEEGTVQNGVGAEIIARLAECDLGKRYYRVAMPNMPIPNGVILENQIMPNANIIIDTIRRNH